MAAEYEVPRREDVLRSGGTAARILPEKLTRVTLLTSFGGGQLEHRPGQ